VQKAFSRNFRETKLLKGTVRLLENEHVRHIRYLKQDIKDNIVWLEKIRESSGESEYGLKPDTPADPRRKSHKQKKMRNHSSSGYNESNKAPNKEVKITIEVTSEESLTQEHDDLEVMENTNQKSEEENENSSDPSPVDDRVVDPDERRQSRLSKTPKRESRMSLTAFERKRKLQSLQKKARHPMEVKKEINIKRSEVVERKVQDYLKSFDVKPDQVVMF